MNCWTLGIDFTGYGRIKIIATAFLQGCEVSLESSRITRQIFLRSELQRVDENSSHYNVAFSACCRYESEMSFVKISHGGNQRDSLAIAPAPGKFRAQAWQGFVQLQISHRNVRQR